MSWNPGDFIKPDKTLPIEAIKDHILNELHRYFHDKKNTSDRLNRIRNIVQSYSINDCLGEIIFDILHAYLADSRSFLEDLLPPDIPAEFFTEVIGFIECDTLPNSGYPPVTIMSLWPSPQPLPEKSMNGSRDV